MATVIITGIAEGLGRTLVDTFLERGDRVIGCDLAGPSLERLKVARPDVQVMAADVASPNDLAAFFEFAFHNLAAVDVLVNNVGIAGPRAPADEVTLEDWQSSLQTNLTGAFLCIQKVLPAMKQQKAGSIVNVSTGSVRTLPPCRAPYITSKAALEGLTRAIAREVGPFGVRCNAVQPGMMDNARLKRVLDRVAMQSGRSSAEVEAELLQYVSMRSKVSMGEVASMIAYLTTESARNVTGQIIAVDGNIEWES